MYLTSLIYLPEYVGCAFQHTQGIRTLFSFMNAAIHIINTIFGCNAQSLIGIVRAEHPINITLPGYHGVPAQMLNNTLQHLCWDTVIGNYSNSTIVILWMVME